MKKVMIVDDNRDIVQTIETIMKLEGYQTKTAYCGEELIQDVGSFSPDLILLDVMMPGYTLQETLSQLKKKGRYKVILVTVVRFMDEEKKDILGGTQVVDYVTKPFELDDLKARVKKALG